MILYLRSLSAPCPSLHCPDAPCLAQGRTNLPISCSAPPESVNRLYPSELPGTSYHTSISPCLVHVPGLLAFPHAALPPWKDRFLPRDGWVVGRLSRLHLHPSVGLWGWRTSPSSQRGAVGLEHEGTHTHGRGLQGCASKLKDKGKERVKMGRGKQTGGSQVCRMEGPEETAAGCARCCSRKQEVTQADCAGLLLLAFCHRPLAQPQLGRTRGHSWALLGSL